MFAFYKKYPLYFNKFGNRLQNYFFIIIFAKNRLLTYCNKVPEA